MANNPSEALDNLKPILKLPLDTADRGILFGESSVNIDWHAKGINSARSLHSEISKADDDELETNRSDWHTKGNNSARSIHSEISNADDDELDTSLSYGSNVPSHISKSLSNYDYGKLDFAMAVLMRKAQDNAKWFKVDDNQQKKRQKPKSTDPDPKALYLFSLGNPFRKAVRRLVLTRAFDFFILVVIVVNCIFLVLDDNPPPES